MARKARIESAFPPEFFIANAVAAQAVAVDPRDENCKGYATDGAGRVTGVNLTIRPVPGSKYEVVRVELINEANAQGQTVAFCSVLDKNSIPTSQMVRLAWEPIAGTSQFRFSGPPGNLENKHIIANVYDPLVKQGPLSLFAGTDSDASQSDIIEGLGLPNGHHVSFRAVWREKGAITPPPVDPPPTPGRSLHRLGAHIIGSAERDINFAIQLPAAMVRLVNPDPGVVRRILANTPSYTLINLRDHLLSEEKAQAVADPTGTGLRHANWWIEQLTTGRFAEFKNNKRIVVVGINEPGVHNLAEELGVYHYNVAFLNRLTSAGIRGMALNLSVGWPREEGGIIQWGTFKPLEPIINAGDHLLNLQSYFYPTPQANWEKLMNRVASCPLKVKIVMAEVGYTRQLAQLPQPWGWRGNISAAQYAEYLWYCADNVDPRVIALCPFTSGFGGPEWESKDVTQELIGELLIRKHNYSWPTPPPPVDPPPATAKTLVLPKLSPITNYFGQLYGGYSHSGIDVSAVTGTPIYCPYPGSTVAWVGDASEASSYGLYVRVSLPAPINTDILFAHNREILVKRGQVLQGNEILSYSGSTGNSTGPHIHIEFRQKNGKGGYQSGVSSHTNSSIDPFGFIAGWMAMGGKVEYREHVLSASDMAQPMNALALPLDPEAG